MRDTLAAVLDSGCQQLGLTLTQAQSQQLIDYTLLLEKWNKTYNLTAIRDAETMMKRHVVDALSVVERVRVQHPQTLADIGTGGGVPGVILAIVMPELQVFLVESIGKKCRFLRHVVTELGLQANVQVVQVRVESWQPHAPLSVVICRAFTSLANFTTITRHLGDVNTVWLAMKAAETADEESDLPADFTLQPPIALTVPFETAKRQLLVVRYCG